MPHSATTDRSEHDYVVVARRYRPQTFDELIGQQHVAQALKRAITNDRVGHAYLFTGARGVGKTSAARILAKALNCEQGPTPVPCNECEICQSISTGEDVDVLEIDGASNRGIDEIRQLRQNVAVRPSRAKLKIYIIDEVHMLTKEAFNALLKTLEEPPEHVKFIFATTEANKIPITILSRCQRFDFAGIEVTAIHERLSQIAAAEGVEIETDALQILAMRAAGSMRDSQSLLEQLLSGGTDRITAAEVTEMLGIAPAARLSGLVRPLVERDAATALSELSAALAEGADESQLIDQLLGYFRDVMTQAVGCDENQMLYALPSQRDEVREIGSQLGVHTLLAIVQTLDQAAARMRLSTHTRTIAEMAVVRICSLENLDELAQLLEQLRSGEAPAAASTEVVKKNLAADQPPRVIPNRRAETPTARSPRPVHEASAVELVEPVSGEAEPSSNGKHSAPSTPAIQLTPANVTEIWQQAMASLSGMLAEFAAQAEEVQLDDGGHVVLVFDNDFSLQRCQKPENRAQLEEALAGVCGAKVPLEMKVVKTSTTIERSVSPTMVRRQKQAEVLAQPFVKKAMELFEGDPAKVKFVPPPENS